MSKNKWIRVSTKLFKQMIMNGKEYCESRMLIWDGNRSHSTDISPINIEKIDKEGWTYVYYYIIDKNNFTEFGDPIKSYPAEFLFITLEQEYYGTLRFNTPHELTYFSKYRSFDIGRCVNLFDLPISDFEGDEEYSIECYCRNDVEATKEALENLYQAPISSKGYLTNVILHGVNYADEEALKYLHEMVSKELDRIKEEL